jgi:hypothetical protein
MVSILALDSGNFTFYEAGTTHYFVYSDAGGWFNQSTSPQIVRGGFAWPGRDQFVLLLQVASSDFWLIVTDTSGNTLGPPVQFTCPQCSSFTFSPVSSSGKLLFAYQDVIEGLVVNYLELQTSIRLEKLIALSGKSVRSVSFFDRCVFEPM